MPTKQINIGPANLDIHSESVRKALETIEEDSFVAETFYKTRDREAPVKSKVIIDLNNETITLPKGSEFNEAHLDSKSLIHPQVI
ncbi:hypothetical protein ACXWQY_09655, partial [Streptococcus pyogenes]